MWKYLLSSLSFFFIYFLFFIFLLIISFFCVIGCFWFIILIYLIFIIISPFIEFSPLGSPLPIYRPFPWFYTPFLWGELEFLINIPFKSIAFLCLNSSKNTLLDLNNLFLVFLFTGFTRLIPYLFINKVAAFQPLYFIILLIENLWFNYIMFHLYSAVLPHSFTLLFGFSFIRGPIPLYKPMPKIF